VAKSDHKGFEIVDLYIKHSFVFQSEQKRLYSYLSQLP
jgi:hypothetical protein